MEVRDKVIGRLSMEKLEKKPNLKDIYADPTANDN